MAQCVRGRLQSASGRERRSLRPPARITASVAPHESFEFSPLDEPKPARPHARQAAGLDPKSNSVNRRANGSSYLRECQKVKVGCHGSEHDDPRLRALRTIFRFMVHAFFGSFPLPPNPVGAGPAVSPHAVVDEIANFEI